MESKDINQVNQEISPEEKENTRNENTELKPKTKFNIAKKW